MAFHPLIEFRGTTIAKAFVLNAIILACIAALSIEFRRYIDVLAETKALNRFEKIILTAVWTFSIGIAIYMFARLMLGFGEGMLAKHPRYRYFL